MFWAYTQIGFSDSHGKNKQPTFEGPLGFMQHEGERNLVFRPRISKISSEKSFKTVR